MVSFPLHPIAENAGRFDHRPERKAGHITLDTLLETWSKGKDSFATDPPNSVLIQQGREDAPVVVKIMNPVWSGSDLVFDVAVLDGELTPSEGKLTVVIDGFVCQAQGFGLPPTCRF